MNENEVLEMIREAMREGATELDLSGMSLTRVPPQIGQLSKLRRLDLSGNELSTLPPQMGQLSNLRRLDLGGNELSTLPPQIGQLSELTTLDLRGNQLMTLPLSIGQLSQLTTLDLRENQLSTLSPEMGQLSQLSTVMTDKQVITLPSVIGQLSHLTTLDLSSNQLVNLPPEIGQLSQLTTLYLRDNQLINLPPEMGQLSQLTALYLRDNQLINLPPEMGQLSQLTTLDLRRNKLSTLPPEIGQLSYLTTLDLRGNQLINLPPEMAQLSNLSKLDLRRNNLSTLPPRLAQLSKLTSLDLRGNWLPIAAKTLKRTNQPAIIIDAHFQASKLDLSNKGLTRVPIELGQLSKLEELDLSGNQLSKLSAEIGQLSKLTTVNLSDNQLSTLLGEIGQLSKLTRLDLSSNQLSTLPPEMGQLSKLTTLDLSNNQLSTLSPEIGQLSQLSTLDLSKNPLRTLPPEMAQLSHLTTLNLSDNQLSTLPPSIGQLSQLTSLDLSSNQLSTLPPEIEQLTQLTSLDLSNNQLTTLPPEIGRLSKLTSLKLSDNQLRKLCPEIEQLSHLITLDLYNNRLRTIPPQIGQLSDLIRVDLSYNQLINLPPEIAQLTNLSTLYLHGNPLPIRPEILKRAQQPATIIEYYLRQNKRPLNEAKLVLVGQARVGKSGLVKRLVENQFDKQEPITEGIAIKEWRLTVNNQQEIKVNIWDFGGLESMHAAHQFFMTQRTLYLLVLDAKQGATGSRIDYWLKLIDRVAQDSPIIVVCNKSDLEELFLDQSALIKKYPTIKAFVHTSCKSGEGIAELERRITGIMGQLEHVRDEIPQRWLEVKAELERGEPDYMPDSDYVQLCRAQNIKQEQEQRILIRLLHDLGVVLSFEHDPKRSDHRLLNFNPAWITGAVYKIINAKPVMQNRGVLEIAQLDDILESHRYPKETHQVIIELMRQLELCFDLPSLQIQAGHNQERVLLPDLLPLPEPEMKWADDSLNFEYHYDFLPSRVISRLIGRMQSFIYQQTYWRHGVLLVNHNNHALLKAAPHANKISISIIGEAPTRHTFWAIIREHIEEIHHTTKGLNPEIKIPLPGHKGINERLLRKLLQKGFQECALLVDDDILVLNVPELLEAITAKSAR